MNKVSVEISANVNEYVQGMNQASESTQKYESDMRRISDYTTSFNKKLRDSKKEVKDLAISYAMLDKETKNSDFGKRMKQQLEAAKKEAAELIDMQGDIQRELKNMASDTKALDMAADSFGLIANIASGAAGAIALVTGNEKDAQRAVVAFTTAQSAMNSVIGIGNALQKESNVMLAVSAIQKKAEAAATQLQTSSTVGATVAQKAFNAVANANPYVLLASAIIAVVGAVTAFIAVTNQAESAEQKIANTLHEASLQGQSDAQAEITKLNTLYKTATDENQTRETRLQAVKKLQQEYPSYLGNLSQEAIMAGQAAGQYQKLATAIINAAKARAYENQITKNQEEIIRRQQKEQEYANRRATEDQRKKAVNNLAKKVSFVAPWAGTAMNAGAEIAGWKEDQDRRENQKEINRLTAENNKLGEEAVKYKQDELSLDKQINKEVSKRGGGGGRHTPKVTKPEEIKYTKGSLADLENTLRSMQDLVKNGFIPEDKILETRAIIYKLEQDISKEKIRLGLEVDPNDEAFKKIGETVRNKVVEAMSMGSPATQVSKNVSSFDKAMGKSEFFDTSTLDGMHELMDANDELISGLEESRKEIIQVMMGLAQTGQIGSEAWLDMIDKLDEYNDALATAKSNNEELSKQVEEKDKEDKALEHQKELYGAINSTLQNMASSIAAVGQAAGDSSLESAMKILGLAVAKVFEGFSYASTDAAKKLGFWGWAAFSASALAQTIAMVAQMKSAGQFAEGGVVSGNSYTGDRLMAMVNSGEAILNRRQQNRALELMDSATTPSNIGHIAIEGRLRGTDILLCGKQTNKSLSKAGNIINIQ